MHRTRVSHDKCAECPNMLKRAHHKTSCARLRSVQQVPRSKPPTKKKDARANERESSEWEACQRERECITGFDDFRAGFVGDGFVL